MICKAGQPCNYNNGHVLEIDDLNNPEEASILEESGILDDTSLLEEDTEFFINFQNIRKNIDLHARAIKNKIDGINKNMKNNVEKIRQNFKKNAGEVRKNVIRGLKNVGINLNKVGVMISNSAPAKELQKILRKLSDIFLGPQVKDCDGRLLCQTTCQDIHSDFNGCGFTINIPFNDSVSGKDYYDMCIGNQYTPLYAQYRNIFTEFESTPFYKQSSTDFKNKVQEVKYRLPTIARDCIYMPSSIKNNFFTRKLDSLLNRFVQQVQFKLNYMFEALDKQENMQLNGLINRVTSFLMPINNGITHRNQQFFSECQCKSAMKTNVAEKKFGQILPYIKQFYYKYCSERCPKSKTDKKEENTKKSSTTKKTSKKSSSKKGTKKSTSTKKTTKKSTSKKGTKKSTSTKKKSAKAPKSKVTKKKSKSSKKNSKSSETAKNEKSKIENSTAKSPDSTEKSSSKNESSKEVSRKEVSRKSSKKMNNNKKIEKQSTLSNKDGITIVINNNNEKCN